MTIKPMLCGKTTTIENLNNHIGEIKYDGERVIAFISPDKIKLQRRSGKNCTLQYPEVVEELKKIKSETILDGEMCVFKDGKDSFQLSQKRMNVANVEKINERSKTIPATYMVFDILDNMDHPLMDRKASLDDLFDTFKSEMIRQTVYTEKLKDLFEKTLANLHEGIIIKEKDSLYIPGGRTKIWMKLKHVKEADIVFTKYDINNAGIKLIKHRVDPVDEIRLSVSESDPITVQCSGAQSEDVRARIDQFGSVLASIEFLELTKAGKMRMPVFKKTVPRKKLNYELITPKEPVQNTCIGCRQIIDKTSQTKQGGKWYHQKCLEDLNTDKEIVMQHHLRFTGGSSDKVYQLKLSVDEYRGYLTIAYGKFGNKLNTSTKPFESIDAATKAYNKKLKSKTNKGYIPQAIY